MCAQSLIELDIVKPTKREKRFHMPCFHFQSKQKAVKISCGLLASILSEVYLIILLFVFR